MYKERAWKSHAYRGKAENEWWIARFGKMRVPAIIYATEPLIRDMDEKVYEQVTNVATLPASSRLPTT